jgi:plasmid stabilization system protein ParE
MVIWSNPAKDDLKKIHDYIAKDSKFYAIKVSQEFIEESENLQEFPKMIELYPKLAMQI